MLNVIFWAELAACSKSLKPALNLHLNFQALLLDEAGIVQKAFQLHEPDSV